VRGSSTASRTSCFWMSMPPMSAYITSGFWSAAGDGPSAGHPPGPPRWPGTLGGPPWSPENSPNQTRPPEILSHGDGWVGPRMETHHPSRISPITVGHLGPSLGDGWVAPRMETHHPPRSWSWLHSLGTKTGDSSGDLLPRTSPTTVGHLGPCLGGGWVAPRMETNQPIHTSILTWWSLDQSPFQNISHHSRPSGTLSRWWLGASKDGDPPPI